MNKDMNKLNESELELVNGGGAQIFNDVRGILASRLGVPVSSISLQSNLIDDLGADSLDVVDIVQGVAQKHNVEGQPALKGIKSVADLCGIVRPK